VADQSAIYTSLGECHWNGTGGFCKFLVTFWESKLPGFLFAQGCALEHAVQMCKKKNGKFDSMSSNCKMGTQPTVITCPK
jgi:hypothetical protein